MYFSVAQIVLLSLNYFSRYLLRITGVILLGGVCCITSSHGYHSKAIKFFVCLFVFCWLRDENLLLTELICDSFTPDSCCMHVILCYGYSFDKVWQIWQHIEYQHHVAWLVEHRRGDGFESFWKMYMLNSLFALDKNHLPNE